METGGCMAKKKARAAAIRPMDVTGYIMRVLVSGYVLALFIALPLFYRNRYYDMGEFKFLLYEKLTWILMIAAAAVGVLHFVFFCVREYQSGDLGEYFRMLPENLSVVDWFAGGYAVTVLLCYCLSAYRTSALNGYEGWSMGLLSQLSFVLLYFLVSRFWNRKWLQDFLWVLCVVSALVFLLAVLHRFRIDPLALYEDMTEYNRQQFLSTIGQATWYSSFLCTVFPVGMLLFWYCNQRWQRICLGVYCFLGYASLVTQNSDSAFMALAAMWTVLLFMSFDSNHAFKRFLEVVILGIASMRLVGLLQVVFAERMIVLDTVSLFWSQDGSLWGLLIALIVVYILLIWAEQKRGFEIASLGWLRLAVIILLLAGLLAILFLMVAATQGRLPEALRFFYDVPYLIFDRGWGNQRGFTWSLSARMFAEYPLREKIIGIGPDCYAAHIYAYYAEEVRQTFGSSVLANAHNEWLNILINEGILGLIAYLGFFLSAAVAFLKDRSRHILLPAVAVCIFSYIFHNLFCYQQVMCTPFIFILIGMGMCYRREEQSEW